MTVREAAVALGLGHNLVYELCKRGKLRHRRLGLGRGVIRIEPEHLREYLEGATSELSSDGGQPASTKGRRWNVPRYVPPKDLR